MKPLSYKGYLGSVDLSIEDDCLHGKVLYVNDLVAYEAASPAGLQKAFEEAVDDYVETCRQVGKDPDKSFKGTFNVRIRPEQHRGAAVAATLHDTTLNDWVAQAIGEKLEGREVHHHNEQHIHIEANVTEPIDFGALHRGGGFEFQEDFLEHKT